MKQEQNTLDSRDEQENRGVLGKIILPLIVIIVVIIIILLMKGKTTVTGEHPEGFRTESLVCEANGKNYEKVYGVSPTSRNVKVSMIFENVNSLQSMNFKYTQDFSTAEHAESARQTTAVTIGLSLEEAGYKTFDFESKVTTIDSVVHLDLVAKKQELDTKSAPFFMIKTSDSNSRVPTTLTDFRQNYESQGFKCEIK